jgi:hypothetical protein
MQAVVKFARHLIILAILASAGVSGQAFANYANAVNFYRANRLYEAAGLFFQAKELARTVSEKRAAEWYLADSLQRLGFMYSASKYYTLIVRRGPRANNPYFRKALEALGQINSSVNLGQSQVVELFKAKVDPSAIPGPARGFYFYYLGVEQYTAGKYRAARSYFERVPPGSTYSPGAEFHLGVIANLSGRHSEAISMFRKVRDRISRDPTKSLLWEQATMNLARVYYETRRFDDSISFYAQIPRNSDNWLDALWEASWAYFMTQKHNNTLGLIHTLHSPFFENRFYPESYILQSITFLRLCRYEEAKGSLKDFQKRYKDVLTAVRSMIGAYNKDNAGFFRLIYDYRTGSLRRFEKGAEVLDRVSRSDAYKEASETIRFATIEQNQLQFRAKAWGSSGLLADLRDFLNAKKRAASEDAGARLYKLAKTQYEYLRDLDNQSGLVLSEILLENINKLRRQINIEAAPSKKQFIGGLQELDPSQDQEYWPFIPAEYWEDELGYYVYNLESRCDKGDRGSGK